MSDWLLPALPPPMLPLLPVLVPRLLPVVLPMLVLLALLPIEPVLPDEALLPNEPLLPAALLPSELPLEPEPALLVPPTAPVLELVAPLALLGEALALPRLPPDAPLPRLEPDAPLLLPRLESWLLPMLEPAPSRLASLPFPSVDF